MLLIIGLSVWAIYLTDHFLDSLKAPSLSSPKYELFVKYRRMFLSVLIALVLTDTFLISVFLPVEFVAKGILLGLFLFLYLSAQHFLSFRLRKYFPKEVAISLIYTAAVWFFPVMITDELGIMEFSIMGVHFLLVLANVLLFSFFERNEDIRFSRPSVSSLIHEPTFRHLIAGICCVVLTGSVACWLAYNIWSMLVPVIISATYLTEMVRWNSRFVRSWYAEITDGLFLLFLVYI